MDPSQGRDKDVLNALEQYSSMVYRLAYARTRNRADAEDIYQEVFLRLAKSAPVSYTHLDVYKRQVRHRTRHFANAG